MSTETQSTLETVFTLPDDTKSNDDQLSLSELAEKCKVLWDKYFSSPKKTKPAIMQEYNIAATAYNKQAGFTCMTIITSTTKDSIKTRPTVPPEIVSEDQKESTSTTAAPEAPVKKRGSVIEEIIALHKQGLTNKEIIAKGYNKSTVGRQVSEFKKKQTNG